MIFGKYGKLGNFRYSSRIPNSIFSTFIIVSNNIAYKTAVFNIIKSKITRFSKKRIPMSDKNSSQKKRKVTFKMTESKKKKEKSIKPLPVKLAE